MGKAGGGAGLLLCVPLLLPAPRSFWGLAQMGLWAQRGSRDLQSSVLLPSPQNPPCAELTQQPSWGSVPGLSHPVPVGWMGRKRRRAAGGAGQESRWAARGWGSPGLAASGAPATPLPCWKSVSHSPETETGLKQRRKTKSHKYVWTRGLNIFWGNGAGLSVSSVQLLIDATKNPGGNAAPRRGAEVLASGARVWPLGIPSRGCVPWVWFGHRRRGAEMETVAHRAAAALVPC